FTASGLLPLTTYYFYIFSYDTNCIGGPLYNTISPLSDSAITNNVMSPVYCTPTSSTGIHINLIEGVGAFANEKNGPTGYTAPGYTNYSNINIATQVSGGGVNINISLAGSSSFGPPPCTSSAQLIGAYVDWNKDGDFTDPNEEVYESTAGTGGQNIFGFVIPSGTPEGIYRLRIRTKSLCLGAGVDPCTSYGGGETEDYSLSVIENCAAQITGTIDGDICGIGSSVTLTAYGTPGTTEYRWYNTPFGGSQIGSSTTNTWITPALSSSQIFYVAAFNGSCESLYRTAVNAYIYDTTDINFTPTTPSACGNDVVAVTAYASQNIQNLFYEGFNSGNYGQMILSTPLNLWDTNGNGITNDGDFPEPRAPWLIQSSPWIPNGTSVFIPAISSGNVGNYYAVAVSDYRGQNLDTRLTTPALNATGYSTLTLTFRQYYSDFNNTDFAYVEISTNGGSTWNAVATYTKDMGNPGVFSEESINLNAYINVSDLRIRFRYLSGWCDGWAIDDIRIFGLKPFVSNYTWSGSGIDAYYQLPTIPANLYSGQAVETIYFLPNGTQIETDDWTFDVTATLPGGCIAQVPITIGNKTKTWKGITNNDWYTATNWAPNGVPDATT
ncbi:MAG: GEVED domain-containing protein, partial [Bacteroidia bacterium]